jgi:hypothetical protein
MSSLKDALPNEGVKTLLQALPQQGLPHDLRSRDGAVCLRAVRQGGPHPYQLYSLRVLTNANVGWLSGRTSSSKGSVSASKQYQKHKEPLFEEKVFFDLKNAQSVVVAFDGISPLPPTYCYLKPDFLPITMSWFEQERIAFDPGEDTCMSFEIIIPFLKPIEHLLMSTTISEIMVNPDGSVWIEEKGHIVLQPGIRFDDGALLTGLEVIANRFGKKLDADSPIMNLRLPDGSRMAALIPPVVNPSAHDDHPQVHLAKLHHR